MGPQLYRHQGAAVAPALAPFTISGPVWEHHWRLRAERVPQTENSMLSSVCVPAACLQIKVWAQCGGTDSPYGQSGADPSLCW